MVNRCENPGIDVIEVLVNTIHSGRYRRYRWDLNVFETNYSYGNIDYVEIPTVGRSTSNSSMRGKSSRHFEFNTISTALQPQESDSFQYT